MAKSRAVSLPRYIATRYVSVGKRSQLVSFMSAISIAGLALSIAILITVLSVMNGFDRELRENILSIVPHITLYTEEPLSEDAWAEVIAQAQRHPQINTVAPFVQLAGVIATPGYTQGVAIQGIDADGESQVSSLGNFMRQGSLEALAENRWGIIVGQGLADRLGVTLGDSIDLFSTSVSINPLSPLPTFRSFEIQGIFRVGTQELDSDLVMINLPAARALFRLRTPYNGVRIATDAVLQADFVASDLRRALPQEFAITTWSRQFGAIYENIRFSKSIIGFMLWLLVGVAAFNLVVSLIMIVRDKTGDIAILRTLGASPGMISRLFIWQGGLIALAGIVIGTSLGVLGALQVSSLASWLEARFGFQLLSAEVYPIDFLPSDLQLSDVLGVIAGVLILSLLVTLYPARRAAAIQPASALRGD
jgi:lipoprotein-releasing system permease protein